MSPDLPTKAPAGKENGKISTETRPRANKAMMRRARLLLGLCLVACDAGTKFADRAPEEVRGNEVHEAVAPVTASAVAPEPRSAPDPPTAKSEARVYAKSRNVWVRSGPSPEMQWLGMLWFGSSVKIRSNERVAGKGCRGSWVPVEPRGWVCVDEERATLDPGDEVLRAISRFAPKLSSPTPHRYAWVAQDIRRFESLAHAEPFLRAWGSRKGGTFGHAAPLLPVLPQGLSERRDHIYARSALAYTADGDSLDTGLLLAADLSWVARSDVELLPEVTFQGVELGAQVHLPMAFFRQDDTPVYEQRDGGEFVATGQHFSRLSHIEVEAPPVSVGRTSYYRIPNTAHWLRAGETVVIDSREPYPKEFESAPETSPHGPSARREPTWLEISILGGWLLAYEGRRPVYATLISAGRGGTPVAGKELVSTASTPTGRFFVNGKFKTATMESSSGPIVHGDVPWTQNFSGPHAIHGAYWHNEWGKLKSAGCVNVSPRDGQWLFEFTEPRVPEGWHGVRQHNRYGRATLVILHD
jgi:hypothetical protein